MKELAASIKIIAIDITNENVSVILPPRIPAKFFRITIIPTQPALLYHGPLYFRTCRAQKMPTIGHRNAIGRMNISFELALIVGTINRRIEMVWIAAYVQREKNINEVFYLIFWTSSGSGTLAMSVAR